MEQVSTQPIENSPEEIIPEGAGAWIRALARLIDYLGSIILGLLGGFLGGIVLVILAENGLVNPGWEERMGGLSVSVVAFSLLGNFLYRSFCEGLHGATLGKLICRLSVVQQDGSPSTMKGSMIRTLGFYFDSLFFGVVGISEMYSSPRRQRYGDTWGETMVLKTRDLPADHPRLGTNFLVGYVTGGSCWLGLMVLASVLKGM